MVRLSRISIGLCMTLLALFPAARLSAAFDDYYELEIDPAAFFLDGYSASFGYASGNARVTAGIFDEDVPEAVRGNAEWNQRSAGATVALDYYPCDCGTEKYFSGLLAGYESSTFELKDSGNGATRGELFAGIRAGYRYMFGEAGFYVIPWLELDYIFGSDVSADGRTFRRNALRLLPAVRLGWRF